MPLIMVLSHIIIVYRDFVDPSRVVQLCAYTSQVSVTFSNYVENL